VIELVVVIAIVALLAAIVFPVMSTVREKGRRTACLSNVRQPGMAALLAVERSLCGQRLSRGSTFPHS